MHQQNIHLDFQLEIEKIYKSEIRGWSIIWKTIIKIIPNLIKIKKMLAKREKIKHKTKMKWTKKDKKRDEKEWRANIQQKWLNNNELDQGDL